MTKTLSLATTLVTVLFMTACQAANDAPKSHIATLQNNAGDTIGTVTLTPAKGGGVRVQVTASGIPEGAHGMHLHEKGDCSSADFKSAGGHINPMKAKHGLKNPDGPDNADMPNALADAKGHVSVDLVNMRVSLRGETDSPALLDDNGSALIMHISPDDQITQPIGGAGARIACAAITR